MACQIRLYQTKIVESIVRIVTKVVVESVERFTEKRTAPIQSRDRHFIEEHKRAKRTSLNKP